MMSSNSAKNIFQFEYIPITSVFEPINSFKKKKIHKTIMQLPLTQRSLLQKHLVSVI